MHDHLRTVLGAPMTTGGRSAPYRVHIRFAGQEGLILLDQIRVLDKRRLVRRLGTVDAVTLDAALAVLRSTFEV
jgi:mRNA interferase MazF